MTDREKLLAWCKKYCNNPDLVDAEDFALVLDNLTIIFEKAGVTSESLSDMSQSFGTDTAFRVRDMLSPYKRLKAI